jgi:hypothetical protein
MSAATAHGAAGVIRVRRAPRTLVNAIPAQHRARTSGDAVLMERSVDASHWASAATSATPPHPLPAVARSPPLERTLLLSRAGDTILRLRLDWPATVGEIAPHFLPNGLAYLLRQCSERLARGTPAALKGAVIGIE